MNALRLLLEAVLGAVFMAMVVVLGAMAAVIIWG